MSKTPILEPAPIRRFDWPGWVCGAVLAAGVIAAYGRTFSVPLFFDDVNAIADNPSIRQWKTALWAPITTTAGGRPVLNLSLAINYAISGTDVWSYHFSNLVIHVLAALILFGIVRRTLRQTALVERFGPRSTALALAVALLWALHPLQTESVTYLIQRAESLMGLFYLLTLYCFIRYAKREPAFARRSSLQASEGGEDKMGAGKAWAVLSVLACFLGMATKEVMVSAPLMVLLYDRTFAAGTFRNAWRRHRWLYVGLAASWVLLFCLVAGTGGNRNGSIGFGVGVPWWKYALTQFRAISTYLCLSFWPHPLVFDRGLYWVTGAMDVLPYAILVLAVLAGTLIALWRRPAVGFLGCWFFAILAPTSSIVPGTTQMIVEHRMYLSLAAVAAFTVVGAYALAGWRSTAAFVILSLPLGLTTSARNKDYQSALTLWGDTVDKSPDNAIAHNNYGNALEKLPGRLNDAIAQYEEALRLKPDYAEAHNNLGNDLKQLPGRLNDAVAQYKEALRLVPNDAEAHSNLGNAMEELPGQMNAAIAQFEEALRLKPAFAEAHNNLGYALQQVAGRLNDAIAQYREALRLTPDYAEAHNNLGNALNELPGQLNNAVAQYEEALLLKPDNAAIQLNLARTLLKIPGRTDEAVAHLEEALRLQPESDAARQILAGIRVPQP